MRPRSRFFLAGAFLAHSNADARAAPICMGKMTNGKPGDDHQFVLVVLPEKVVGFAARGFTKTNCGKRKEFATKTKPLMCTLAGRSNTAVDDNFGRIYSVTPREICEL